MFETIPTNPTTPPVQSASEPDDIFATADKLNTPSGGAQIGTQMPPVAPQSAPPAASAPPVLVAREGSRIGRILLEVLAVLTGIAIVVGGGYFILASVRSTDTPALSPSNETQAESGEGDTSSSESSALQQEPVSAPPASLDTDGDGLTDDQEKALGTEPFSIDTDRDGLFDGDEVNTWKTNPLIADTDGDGYTDGEEVRNGYNPNGPGKIAPSGAPAPALTP